MLSYLYLELFEFSATDTSILEVTNLRNRKVIGVVTLFAVLLMVSLVHAQSYQTVTIITGTGDQTSDNFHISSSEWRIYWSYTPSANLSDPSMAMFGFFVYPSSSTTMYVDSIDVSGINQTSGFEYVHQGNGDFYVQTNVANVDGYTLRIQQPQSTTTTTTTPTTPEYPLIALLIGLLAVVSLVLVFTRKR